MRMDHVVIRASAGTGKTWQLSNRYLGLLQSGAPAEQILATTFTRKAAGEILERVISRLAAAACDETRRGELVEALGDDQLSRARCLDLLQRLTRNLHRLRIGTLDSFYSQLASSFSLELGLPPGWRIVEELVDAGLRGEAIEQILQGDKEVARLVQLLAKGDADRSVSELVRATVNGLYGLYCQTGREAWSGLPQARSLDDAELEAWLSRLESSELPEDARFVRARGEDLQAAGERDWERFIGRGLASKVLAGERTYYRKEIPPATWECYSRLVEHARAVLLAQLAEQTLATYELLDRFDRTYRRLKRDARGLRFEDVTAALAASPLLEQVDAQHFRLDCQLSHLLLDEFQDTSLEQWRVLRPFAQRITRRVAQRAFAVVGGQPSLFCVGDVKQAIYGWRGGQAEIFEALEAELSGLRQEHLDRSFRSAQPVIDAVNLAFQRLARHPLLEACPATLATWSERFKPHTTARTSLPGYVCLRTSPAAEGADQQEAVTLQYAAVRTAELARTAPGRSIGVLVRRNRAVAQMVFQLRRLGVPASEEGGMPLVDSVAVQTLLSLAQLADHPGDRVARFHVAHSPLGRSLGFEDDRDGDRARELARELRRQLLEDGFGPTVEHWVRLLAPACGPRELRRLEQLVELSYAYQAVASLRPRDWVRYVRSQRVADPSETPVRVMTVHQAKGLQFDIVVLPDLAAPLIGQADACVVGRPTPTEPIDRVCLYRNQAIQQLLPASFQQLFVDYRNQQLSEALCVLYVALTRPVHQLDVIVPPAGGGERKLPQSFAGLLRAVWCENPAAPPETLLYSHGDADWAGAGEEPPPPAAESAAAESAAAESVATESVAAVFSSWIPPGPSRRPALRRQAPSALEGGSLVDAAHLLDLRSDVAMARGTLVHAWFEQLEWLDDGGPSRQRLREVAQRLGPFPGVDVEGLLDDYQAMLEAPQVAAALSREFYESAGRGDDPRALWRAAGGDQSLHVYREKRFAVRCDDQLLTGTVDRLVVLKCDGRPWAADIVDFKTDRLEAGDEAALERAVNHYLPQLAAYRDAVSRMYRLDSQRVSARLLFVGCGQARLVNTEGMVQV